MNLARVAWDENNLGRTHELLEKHRPRPGETDLRGFEWHYLRRLFQRDLLTVKAHAGGVTAVAFTPDGKRLVTVRIEPTTAEVVRPEARRCEALGCGDRPAASLPAQRPRRQSGKSGPQPRRHPSRRDSSGNQTVLVWDLATGGLVTLEGPASRPPAVWISVPTASDWSARTARMTTIPSRTRRVRSGSGTWSRARPS